MPNRYERRTRRNRIVAMVVVLGMVVVLAAVLIAANGQ
jgi:ABC-type transporter Mla subunit MlaD